MISEIIESIDTEKSIERIQELLIFEKNINIKKIKNEKLTSEERFFDNYMLKPSFIIKLLERRIK